MTAVIDCKAWGEQWRVARAPATILPAEKWVDASLLRVRKWKRISTKQFARDSKRQMGMGIVIGRIPA